jgi:hypothetical protein
VLIKEWQHSIVNHLYWCAASTPVGEGQLTRAKWESLLDHVQNIHTGHGILFPDCAHGAIDTREQKKWFLPCKLQFISTFETRNGNTYAEIFLLEI